MVRGHHRSASLRDGDRRLDEGYLRCMSISSMSLEDIRKRLANRFRPLVIRTSDGREFPVPHREFVFLIKRSVIVADEEGYVDILDPLHIAFVCEAGNRPTK